MRRWMVTSLLLTTLAAAGCESEPHVVRGSTLTQRFAALGKNGWAVSGDGINETRRPGGQGDLRYTGNGTNFFGGGAGGPEWKTNFKTDDPTPPARSTTRPFDNQPPALDPFTGLPIR